MTFIKCSHRILLAAIMVAPGLALVPQFAFGEGGGRVLKPEAKPHGYSLTDMASAITLFSTSGNSSAYYPNTPFQILSEDTSTVVVTPESGGIVVTATNSFTVTSGTQFFVALYYADDSPVVIGTFPTDECSAAAYIFDQCKSARRTSRLSWMARALASVATTWPGQCSLHLSWTGVVRTSYRSARSSRRSAWVHTR